jgi:GT2 family glycosyltransferase
MSKGAPELDVSVIIVSWNAKEFLMRCLASLYSDEVRRAKEIIVVDNCSTDGSPEAVESRYPAVRLIRNSENLGFAKANNVGVKCCNGRYVCFINSDAEVIGDCLGQLVDYCDTHRDVGMVGPRVTGRDGNVQRTCRGFPTVWNTLCSALALDRFFPKVRIFTGYSLAHWPQEDLREVDILGGCFWLARREAIDVVGLLDEQFFIYGEDMDWCKRFWAKGLKLVFVPDARAIHYGGASSANAPVRFAVEMQRADLQYWKKHHSLPGVACYFGLSCLHATLRAAGYVVMLVFAKSERTVYCHKIERNLACLRDLLGRCFRSQRAGAQPPRAEIA